MSTALATGLRSRLRYVPLAAAGVQVFLGIIFLGDLTGLLWHSRTFGWWVPLDASVLGSTSDWFVWGFCFLTSVAPSIVKASKRGIRPDTVLVLTSIVLPCLSLVAVSMSYYVGATLLVGSGFLAAYAIVSRSESLLNMQRGSAVRVVLTEVFAFLSVAAAGGVVSILLWQEGAFIALILGYDSTDAWLSVLKVDMESFYLARPIFLAIFAALAIAAIIALFREPFWSLARLMTRRIRKGRATAAGPASAAATRGSARVYMERLLPYVVLAGSVALGIAITVYPYAAGKVRGVIGSDMWFYTDRLTVMSMAPNPLSLLEADRGFFLLSLYALMYLTHLPVTSTVRLAPGLCSALFAVTTFLLVKEGTKERWLAALAALLSVVSSQTSLGMGAGIMANWFALSFANVVFALAVRAVRLRSRLAVIGSVALSIPLLWSYAYMWVVSAAILLLVLIATLVSFRSEPVQEWRRELAFLSTVLGGIVAVPVVLLYALTSLTGQGPPGLNVTIWIGIARNYVSSNFGTGVLITAPSALEEAFDFAGNRVDLPFLTLLSVIGLLSFGNGSHTRSFRRFVAAMVVVPIAITLISPDLYLTWRGLYLIPTCLTGALGTESVIRIVNGRESPWRSLSRLAFGGTFASYVFLSHLSYSLRALELLILAALSW